MAETSKFAAVSKKYGITKELARVFMTDRKSKNMTKDSRRRELSPRHVDIVSPQLCGMYSLESSLEIPRLNATQMRFSTIWARHSSRTKDAISSIYIPAHVSGHRNFTSTSDHDATF